MPTAACKANIDKKQSFPPCTDSYCTSVSFAIGVHCSQSKPPLDPDTPIGPQLDPNLNGQGKPGYCYCCCSCFAGNTPIESSPGQFTLAMDIRDGDEILAAGPGLNWKPAKVQEASTWGDASQFLSMYFVRYAYPEGVATTRDVIVSPDHLFLMENGQLLAVQNLVKGLNLRRADGELSAVVLVAKGTFTGGITSILMAGDFDGKNLNGHLLNSNGIVSADFKVQVYYASDRLSADVLYAIPDSVGQEGVGTAAYHETVPDAAYAAFIDDSSQWPQYFLPEVTRSITPPKTAHSFLTSQQAMDVRRNAPRGGVSNTYPIRAVLYLFKEAQGFYPDITFLVDWENPVPNAYSWDEWGRQYVLVTGGLIRVTTLLQDGLSLIISAMIAYRNPTDQCVGEADYNAVNFIMHDLWVDDVFVAVVEKALPQIQTLFSYIDPPHRGGDPKNPCKSPSIECRLSAYQAGLMFFPVPTCAKPKPDYFEVKDTQANNPTTVQILFTRELDPATAQTIANYALDPVTEITGAFLNLDNPMQVLLSVPPLEPMTTYVVTVTNVVSNDGVNLDPNHNQGAFITE